MLRAAIIGCAGLALLWVVAAALLTGMPLWGAAAMLAILLVLLLVERVRYKPLADSRPPPPWEATQERFVDPETGVPVRVFFNPRTGERRYVADGPAPGD